MAPAGPLGALVWLFGGRGRSSRHQRQDLGASLRGNVWSYWCLVEGIWASPQGQVCGWGPPKAELEAADHFVATGDPEQGMGLESLANCPLLP